MPSQQPRRGSAAALLRVIPAGRIRVRGCGPALEAAGPGCPAAPPGGSLGSPGAPAAPCPGRAEPCRLCRRLRGISGAKRSSAADPEAGPQPGQGRPQEEEEGEAEARWPEVARPLPPRRDCLCGDRRFRCG